ncbi:MAG: universal stress protein [Halobacteriales archaeon]
MYDTVLVPTDGSPSTARVLTHATELADRFDATLHGLYVLDLGDIGLGIDAGVGRVGEALGAMAEPALERIAARGDDAGIRTETATREGRPHEEIVDYVVEMGADVVVMGTHGRSGVERVLLGSVTERVVRLSPVPVLTVGLTTEDPVVAGEAAARSIADDALAEDGHEDAEITEVYREAGTWVVRADSPRSEYNVHIDAATGDAVVAVLPE